MTVSIWRFFHLKKYSHKIVNLKQFCLIKLMTVSIWRTFQSEKKSQKNRQFEAALSNFTNKCSFRFDEFFLWKWFPNKFINFTV